MSKKKVFFLVLTGLFAIALTYGVWKNFTVENEPVMAWVQVGVLIASVIAHICVWVFLKNKEDDY